MTLPYVKNDFIGGPARHKRLISARLTADGTLALPAYHAIRRIYIDNETANAVTGGLDIGTTDGGQEVLAAKAVGANATVETAPVASVFLATAQTLYITAASAWNSSALRVLVDCDVVSSADETV